MGGQCNPPLLLLLLALLQLSARFFKLRASMLCLELLAHGEGNRTVVERVVGLYVRVDVTLDAQKEQASLRHVKRHLANDLLEALLEELFANWADTAFPRLALHQLLVEHLTEPRHINPACRLRARLLDPVLAALNPLTRWDDRIQHVLAPRLRPSLHRRQSSSSTRRCTKREKLEIKHNLK